MAHLKQCHLSAGQNTRDNEIKSVRFSSAGKENAKDGGSGEMGQMSLKIYGS